MSGITTLVIEAPAKINLFLAVGGPRPDGFHDLVTVFQSLELSDEVRISRAKRLSVSCTPESVAEPEDNLAYRAAEAFGRATDLDPSVRIEIEKRIPVGAGLGGGSSDAAAVIFGLASLEGLDPKGPEAVIAAREIGSDVPFFLQGGTALYTGRGDVFDRSLPTLDTYVALVVPDAPVSTPAAYVAFDGIGATCCQDVAPLITALEAASVVDMGASLANNMTQASVTLLPDIAKILDEMRRIPGVRGALMSGSGSSCFAICSEIEIAESVVDIARDRGWWTEMTRFSKAGVRLTGRAV